MLQQHLPVEYIQTNITSEFVLKMHILSQILAAPTLEHTLAVSYQCLILKQFVKNTGIFIFKIWLKVLFLYRNEIIPNRYTAESKLYVNNLNKLSINMSSCA